MITAQGMVPSCNEIKWETSILKCVCVGGGGSPVRTGVEARWRDTDCPVRVGGSEIENWAKKENGNYLVSPGNVQKEKHWSRTKCEAPHFGKRQVGIRKKRRGGGGGSETLHLMTQHSALPWWVEKLLSRGGGCTSCHPGPQHPTLHLPNRPGGSFHTHQFGRLPLSPSQAPHAWQNSEKQKGGIGKRLSAVWLHSAPFSSQNSSKHIQFGHVD